MIDIVITSCGRLDLLKRTINSLIKYIDYPINKIIIIDDSASNETKEGIVKFMDASQFPSKKVELIFNKENIGLINSIDKAYQLIESEFFLHCEDDWEFLKAGFIEPSLKIIQNNHLVMQTWISNIHNQPIDAEIQIADGIQYRYASIDGMDHLWHGFTLNPGIRSLRVYKAAAPWAQWSSSSDFLALRECKIGYEYFLRGFRAAVLLDSYCIHIGGLNSTWAK
jgi:hypothetical protein